MIDRTAKRDYNCDDIQKARKLEMNVRPSYDLMNFEALGEETGHLDREIRAAKRAGLLPKEMTYVNVQEDLQDYLAAHPDTVLPDIITVKTHSVLPADYVGKGKKKSVVTRSAGYDHLEHLQETANIASLREYCVNAVAQTAVKLMYNCCGYMNRYTKNAGSFDRDHVPSFMELNETRTATVFGVGRIGKKTYDLAKANGLNVLGVDIREKELSALYGDSVRFVSKEEAAEKSDIILNLMSLTRDENSRFYNVGYFSEYYLSTFHKPVMFINVTRGEIASEEALLSMYNAGKIKGIGLDVFSGEAAFAASLTGKEPKDANGKAALALLRMALDRTGNVYVQPHQGFNSDAAAAAKAREAIRHVIAYYKNGGERFDEQLPYYEK